MKKKRWKCKALMHILYTWNISHIRGVTILIMNHVYLGMYIWPINNGIIFFC